MFDHLFYIFYCSVRRGFGFAERASFLLSISVTAYAGALCFLFIVLTKSDPPDPIIGPMIFFIFGIGVIYGVSRYFVGSGRYREIVDKYGAPHLIKKRRRILYIFVAWTFFLGSFIAFGFFAFLLSKYLNIAPNLPR